MCICVSMYLCIYVSMFISVLLTTHQYAAEALVSENIQKHLSQVNLSREGEQILKNLGVTALTDVLYLRDSDLEKEGMTVVDQRKVAKLQWAARENKKRRSERGSESKQRNELLHKPS